MNLLDVLVLAGVVSAALGGFRVGFLARVASWIGLAVGFYVGIRLAPTALEVFDLPAPPARLLVTLTVIVLGAFVGQALGLVVGHRVRGVLPVGGARTADRISGAVAGGLSVMISLWLFLPTLANVPGWAAQQTRNSTVVRVVGLVLPDPPNTTEAVSRLIDERGFPRVFEAIRPAPDAGLPPPDSGMSPDVVERVKASTVKIEGEACRRIQEGSGFVVSENVVVTNAHVVAGEDRIEVVRNDGKRLPAALVVFDAGRDLAVLKVDRLGLAALGRDAGERDEIGAVFGHPNGQDEVRVAPARISDEVPATGNDIYGGRTQRQVYILAADLEPGDSGGALVNKEGKVIGAAFAIAPDRPDVAYALADEELDAVIAAYSANPNARPGKTRCV